MINIIYPWKEKQIIEDAKNLLAGKELSYTTIEVEVDDDCDSPWSKGGIIVLHDA